MTMLHAKLVRLGSAKELTREGTGTMFPEPDQVFRWDLA